MTQQSSGISAVMDRFLQKIPDSRYISLSTQDGIELINAAKNGQAPEGSQLASSLVSGFAASIDQSSRMNLGKAEYSLAWAGNSIVLQSLIGGLVLTLILDETANVGAVDDYLPKMIDILQPFSARFNEDQVS
jgi:thiol:disulfide interchange protein